MSVGMQRQKLRGEGLDVVGTAPADLWVQQLGAQLADLILETADAPRSEGTRHQHPQRFVDRRVREDQEARRDRVLAHDVRQGAIGRADDLVGLLGERFESPGDPVVVERVRADVRPPRTAQAAAQSVTRTIAAGLVSRLAIRGSMPWVSRSTSSRVMSAAPPATAALVVHAYSMREATSRMTAFSGGPGAPGTAGATAAVRGPACVAAAQGRQARAPSGACSVRGKGSGPAAGDEPGDSC
ncbi:hypothetical protein FrEUN1fDRAFT_4314 [Parafrankia sp. EUN1f]|nr:hypothetical protein FrEUN1fDRAFT_4314 [Parafrankia sp. EUN1f]